MEKLKARKLRRLKTQKDGWEKAFQLISQKYKPSQKVEDIQRLLKDCGSGTANFTDRPIDAATAKELNVISEKYSIECRGQKKTTRQYYALAKEQLEQISKECDGFEINYKKRQRKRLIEVLSVISTIVLVFCGFVYLGGLKYLQAEKYMREENYEAALEWYSKCGDFWNTSNKEAEAKYQIAEAYLRNENDEEALKWYIKCNDYKDAKDKAEKIRSKIGGLVLQLLGLEENSLEDIYTLGNEIPCGLVKYSISYDDFLNANGDNLVDKKDDALTYGDYFLYGYSCEIKYYFDLHNILREIRVYSPYIEGEVEFAGTDIEKIGQEIKSKLDVEPEISSYKKTPYTFEKDGIMYKLATYASPSNDEESNIQIRLIIKAK